MHSSVCQGNIQHLPNLIMNSVTQNYIIDLHFVWVLKTAMNISCFIKPSFNTTAVVSTYHGGLNMHQQLGVDLGEGAWTPPPPYLLYTEWKEMFYLNIKLKNIFICGYKEIELQR